MGRAFNVTSCIPTVLLCFHREGIQCCIMYCFYREGGCPCYVMYCQRRAYRCRCNTLRRLRSKPDPRPARAKAKQRKSGNRAKKILVQSKDMLLAEQRNDKANKERDAQSTWNSHKALALCVVLLASVTLCLKYPRPHVFWPIKTRIT